MSVGRHAKTIVKTIANLDTWEDLELRFNGTAPTVRDIDGMIPPAYQLMARSVSTMLTKYAVGCPDIYYVGVMPAGSTEITLAETLEELVPGLRIFCIKKERDSAFTVKELEVATPAEIQEARELAAHNERKRVEEARLKQKLHTHYEQLLSALATLSRRERNELPQCDGNCERFTRPCPCSMEKIIKLCDDAGIDITTVMMEAVTKVS